MNILHFAPNLRCGGTRSLAADLACELQLRELAHGVVMAPSSGMDDMLAAARVKRVGAATGLLQVLRNGVKLRWKLRRNKVDIILAYTDEAAWVAGRVCSKMPPSMRPKLVGVISTYPRKSIFTGGWEYCDAFTAVSKHLCGELEKFSPVFRRKTPWVIPYGVREEWCNPGYKPDPAWMNKWHDKYATDDKVFNMCLPAPFSPLHGHDDLVPLLSALRRSDISPRVFLVGNMAKADTRYLAQLRERFHKAQLTDSIIWMGARAELRDVLYACDITLSLDKQAAADNRPVLEALALGKPVVGYDSGVVGEMLNVFLPEGRVAPGQVESMADTITQWSFYHPSTVEKVPYPYSMADTADNYMELFQDLLNDDARQ